MCSYNRLNGTYACEDTGALQHDLRDTFGFDGFVRSDGFALVDTVRPALNGCDQVCVGAGSPRRNTCPSYPHRPSQEMPHTVYFGAALGAAVAEGQVPEATVRGMVTNFLTAAIALNLLSDPVPPTPAPIVTTPAHAALARSLAAQAAVLLKNEGALLPFTAADLESIAVFGDNNTVLGAARVGAGMFSTSQPLFK